MTDRRPEWSSAFDPEVLRTLERCSPLEDVTPDWAWGGSTGEGVKVAVIDSGIDVSHPEVDGHVAGYVAVTKDGDTLHFDDRPHSDAYGHGTACAGIIRRVAPDCLLYSVKVLGPDLRGRGEVFIAGLRWAVQQGMNVCNLSLGTSKRDFFGVLHDLADEAYFRNTVLVTAANNLPVPSFPSVFASVLSVAACDGSDPFGIACNPKPPVEFGAPGINVRVAWAEGQRITATGNSFAAPHVTGLVARLLAKHPGLTVPQVKVVLRGLATNLR